MILLIDNYDSFVHNLARYFRRLGHATQVVRNDAVDADEVRRLNPAAVVISPGPCTPRQAGCSLEVIRRIEGRIPMLGVCLGHQALAEALGGRTVRAPRPMHGRTSAVRHDGRGIFQGLPQPLTVCRYHSLMVDPDRLPAELQVTAWSDDGVIMAIRHNQFPMIGVQFHPEAVLTEFGYPLLANFLHGCGLPAGPVEGLAGGERLSGLSASTTPTAPVTF